MNKTTLIQLPILKNSKLDFCENLQLSRLDLELFKVSRIKIPNKKFRNAQVMNAYDDLMINIQIENWDVT